MDEIVTFSLKLPAGSCSFVAIRGFSSASFNSCVRREPKRYEGQMLFQFMNVLNIEEISCYLPYLNPTGW